MAHATDRDRTSVAIWFRNLSACFLSRTYSRCCVMIWFLFGVPGCIRASPDGNINVYIITPLKTNMTLEDHHFQ